MQFQFDTTLAARYSVEEAVFVHNIYFWVMRNEANGQNAFDGMYWTYNSMPGLSKIFHFWTVRQIERIVRKCRENGLILTRQLSDNPRDRTLWYTVTETVRCIYAFGGMDTTITWDGHHQTVGCYKEQIVNTDSKPDSVPTRPEKQIYGEFANVKLTDAELDKLTARWTMDQVQQEVEDLSAYMKSKGKRYADHYATLLNWLKRDHPGGAKPSTQKTTLIEEGWCNGST